MQVFNVFQHVRVEVIRLATGVLELPLPIMKYRIIKATLLSVNLYFGLSLSVSTNQAVSVCLSSISSVCLSLNLHPLTGVKTGLGEEEFHYCRIMFFQWSQEINRYIMLYTCNTRISWDVL